MSFLQSLKECWRDMRNWTECYPMGWHSHIGIGMTHDECNHLMEMELEWLRQEREQARTNATRPEYV